MRIGVVTTSYPRAPGDYAGGFVADRVAALLAEGHEVDVVAAGGGAATCTTSRDAMSREATCKVGPAEGFTLTRLPAPVPSPSGGDLFGGAGAPEILEAGGAATLWAAARFSIELASTVRARAGARRWDRVESHWLAPCALAVASGAPGLPHRATAHSGDVSLLERAPFGRSLARLLVRAGVELVFASAALRDRFAALAGGAHGVVIPVEPARDFFARAALTGAAARAALALPAAPTVVSVGRLVPIKGLDLLVRACAPLATDAASLSLVVVGDGPERARLAALAARLGVSLRLAGAVPRADVRTWLGAADLYAQPSRRLANGRTEGTPVATLEALASGLPVVASDSGGLAALSARGADVSIVPAGDVRALARALRKRLDTQAPTAVQL
jgi:glycosyltransferase involved in cell wall biosynthesis